MKIGCRSVKSHCIPFPSSDTKGDKTGSSGKLRSPDVPTGRLDHEQSNGKSYFQGPSKLGQPHDEQVNKDASHLTEEIYYKMSAVQLI